MLLSVMPVEETDETRVRNDCCNFDVSLCTQIINISIRGHCDCIFVDFRFLCTSRLHKIS